MKLDLAELGTALPDRIGLFVCAASFEKRCLSIPEVLLPEAIGNVLICSSAPIARYSRSHEKRLLHHFGAKAQRVPHSGEGPIAFADAVRMSLSGVARSSLPTVVVDITTFTREALLILLKMLAEWAQPGTRIFVVYNGAERYEMGKRKWLSADYREVRSVLGYPGELRPTQNLHLIVLFGFEVERAVRAVRAFDPAVLSLGHGDEEHSITAEHYRRNVELFERIATVRPGVNRFTLSVDDPFRTSTEIISLANRYPTYNTVVVAMNTKLSTVGAALAAWTDPRIQLAYVSAHRYNISGYSEPNRFAHLFEMPMVESAAESAR